MIGILSLQSQSPIQVQWYTSHSGSCGNSTYELRKWTSESGGYKPD